LGHGRAVLVGRVVFVVVRTVVLAVELNRPDVTAARAYFWDIYPALPYLIPSGTHGIIPRINRLAGREEGEMPLARCALIGKGS